MRLLSLAVFAVLALVIGAYEEDGMTLMIGGASALAAVASMPSWRLSTFLTILADLFAIETVLFGIADLVALLGYWPHAYEEYELPRYLPLATAIFVIVIFAVSHIPLVRKMMRIADPFFAARTPISIRPWPLPPTILRQNLYARINVFFLILINQFQVAVSLRFNFWQRDFGNAIQVADEAHRVAFWYQLMVVFVPLATIAIVAGIIEFFVASNFVLQWRRWMTASFTSRWLLHSMHYKLALNTDNTDNPDQRISQDVGSFINGSGTGSNSGNVGIYNYTIQLISSATNLVSFSVILWGISSALKAPIFGVEIPGFLFWVAVLYAVVATGITQLIGRSLSKLYFRQQAVEANFRFDLARVREYSEQIALLKGENREIERAGTVFDDVFRTIRRIIHVRTWLIAFNQFYSQISVIIPYVVIAPFYYMKIVDFGRFSQSADAFGNVNSAMNFFVDRYIGLADFSSAIARLTTFEDSFDKTLADGKKEPRLTAAPGSGPSLSFPDVDLALPDGRKLAHIGDLALIPQESALVVGPSGVGKSTLFRAISGLWPFGSGEIQQPAFARLMLLPQRPYIPIGPLREALAYPAASSSFSDAQLRDALYHVGLPALVERLDESDNWQMRLSGGEQQRLAIARALLAAPDWLFLDESTASLDEESEADLYRAIAKALPNTTLVSIGHRSTLNAFHRRRIAFEPHEGAPATVVSAA
ncbi:ABC transporter ATP-binding protein/permease [Roseiarcus sp.]|uniref:ABC transporter ATP-binding protein/permease n=2 Tax=Roseiarcus sp. TaxID=1969460 RepID=UPI003C44B48E